MERLRDLFKNKDKKTIFNIGAALLIGVFLLVISSPFFRPKESNPAEGAAGQAAEPTAEPIDYAADLEKRMEGIFAQMAGVGKVKVMLTLAYGREIVIAEDKTANESNTKETDQSGGERISSTKNEEEKTIIITDKNGESYPLILKEIQPQIEGVLIVAEGGDNVKVQALLTHAAEALLGVSANKVQVSKMKR